MGHHGVGRDREEGLAIPLPRERERRVEVVRPAHLEHLKLQPQPPGTGLRFLHDLIGVAQFGGNDEHGHAHDPREGLLQKLEALWHEVGERDRQAGDVAAGVRWAVGPAFADRVAAAHGHDGNRAGRPACGFARRRAASEHDVKLQLHQLGGLRRQPLGRTVRVAPFDVNVLPVHVPGSRRPCSSPLSGSGSVPEVALPNNSIPIRGVLASA